MATCDCIPIVDVAFTGSHDLENLNVDLCDFQSDFSPSSLEGFRGISGDETEDFLKAVQPNSDHVSLFNPLQYFDTLDSPTAHEVHPETDYGFLSPPSSSSDSLPPSPVSHAPTTPLTPLPSLETPLETATFSSDYNTHCGSIHDLRAIPMGCYESSPRTQRMKMADRYDKEENRRYEKWTHHVHVRPDGSCKCFEKKNAKKCVLKKTKRKRSNQLWHFILELLNNPRFESYIHWVDREAGVFKIEQSQKVAKLWGQRKHKPAMSYEYMSRGMRHYYLPGIMRRLQEKRLIYQFGPNAENWKYLAGL